MLSRHLIDLDDLSLSDLHSILQLAHEIRERPGDYFGACQNKILATLFYEPSTRTQMSFQTAMLRLGGQTIGFDNPLNSSVAKGENLKDTIKIVSGYADIIAVRNPQEGFAKAASLYSNCPIINAGDGGHLHPTQTLTDLTTLMEVKGDLHGLTIGMCGDLKNGRTVHSLIKTMCHFRSKFVLISTPELTVPQYIKDIMDASGCPYTELTTLEEAMPLLDVLYMTRIQRERFSSPEEYERQKNVYVLDKRKMALGRKELKVLHPLPRVDEIEPEVDDDRRAIYFDQAIYGMYARMSLIIHMLDEKNHYPVQFGKSYRAKCQNPRCVTQQERYLPSTFTDCGDMLICDYCDGRTLI
ncbi:aspartate carbamoyltransferase [Zongyangia hominis]|uniref:Aspartate carbamoyltransferase n=1 Tax=Zongyangia hominis TaxID=2763677 RepID=A0A926IC56_9FIRM|nr:aspartate carbamoyltransferase [Zongyangia hominis]MBC8570872.1 aspartate carbamoyltransferase [Zongyangia hominis]